MADILLMYLRKVTRKEVNIEGRSSAMSQMETGLSKSAVTHPLVLLGVYKSLLIASAA